MMKSRRDSSTRVYTPHITKWRDFCKYRNIHDTYTTVPRVLEFLQTLVDRDFSYSTVNMAKSAITTCIILPQQEQLGLNPDVKTFMRGVFNLRPPLTRHTHVCDPDQVLNFLKSREGPDKLPTEPLVKFLATLILLTTGQRPQILTALRITDLCVQKDRAIFTLQNKDVKQGRPGYKPPVVSLRKYEVDPKLCVYTHLVEYMKRSKHNREKVDQLFITCKKPFKAITANTGARWVKDVLRMSGVDTTRYSAGSARAAATSKAQTQGAPIDIIMAAAGWSNSSTFAKYYCKQVVMDQDLSAFILP